MFQAMISQCVENFGEPPRRFPLWDRLTYLRVGRPAWLKQNSDDRLENLFRNLSKLKRDGKVVWAHIIQANGLLFSPGQDDCPAEVVYSLDDSKSIAARVLGGIASSLYSLKETKPDDAKLAFIAHYLTDERTRVFGIPVPPVISPGLSCMISSTYIVRKHLPKPRQWLGSRLLPLIVYPAIPHVALPLPSRYWPQEMIEWWVNSD